MPNSTVRPVHFEDFGGAEFERLSGVDKMRLRDSPDAVKCDSKLTFMQEISIGPRPSER